MDKIAVAGLVVGGAGTLAACAAARRSQECGRQLGNNPAPKTGFSPRSTQRTFWLDELAQKLTLREVQGQLPDSRFYAHLKWMHS